MRRHIVHAQGFVGFNDGYEVVFDLAHAPDEFAGNGCYQNSGWARSWTSEMSMTSLTASTHQSQHLAFLPALLASKITMQVFFPTAGMARAQSATAGQ